MAVAVIKLSLWRNFGLLPFGEKPIGRLRVLALDRKHFEGDLFSDFAMLVMTSGGDERILLDPLTGLNRYLTAPRPMEAIAYSSSTANSLSPAAMSEVTRKIAQIAPGYTLDGDRYGAGLDVIRARLRRTWKLPASVDIVFAASGTDLEYAGLAIAHRADAKGIDNILLGVDEVGSGCVHSASGFHFANATPLGVKTNPGSAIDPEVAAMVRLVNIGIRTEKGQVIESEDVLLAIGAAAEAAIAGERHPLIHVVHGSKTGLILPSLAHIDALRRRFGSRISFVVDACQARISRDVVSAYLSRGCTVFLTGSKFMGGPPFSGFALVPAGAREQSAGLLPGFETVFSRAEWPEGWIGRERLRDIANLGLLLRLEASLFELELYHGLNTAEIKRTLDLFDRAIAVLTQSLGATRVVPFGYAHHDLLANQPLEMRTLVTIDLSQIDPRCDFDFARKLHQSLVAPTADPVLSPVRLGQPAKCIRLADGRYGGNLRIGLSMPQMVEYAAMDSHSLEQKLTSDMLHIANRITRLMDF
jgi:hypothetical protein